MSIAMTRERVEETVTRFVYSRPLTFNEWLEISGPNDFDELIDGTIVEKPMVQLDHEKLNLWLLHILDIYSQERKSVRFSELVRPYLSGNFAAECPTFFSCASCVRS